MGTLATVAGFAVLAGALAAACGAADGPVAPPPAPAAAAVGISSVSGVGTVLVDGHGKALYANDLDHGADVRCTGMCAQVWPPAYVSGTTAPAGSAPGVTVLQRSDDGRAQLAYRGQPLYEFRLDVMAGQVTGNDVTDQFDGMTFVWHAAAVVGGC